MTYTLRADFTHNCIPQTPVVLTQGRGPGVPSDETEEDFEERFESAVSAAKAAAGGADPPGACP